MLTERERKKFLKERADDEYDVGGMDDGTMGAGPNAGGGVNNASRNMLGSNNDYFYNDQHNKGDVENNDDDFWYGAPKGGAYDQPGQLGGNEYQSYIGGTQPVDPSIMGRSGRKPPSGNKRR